MPPDLDIHALDKTLRIENASPKLRYFEEGEKIQFHAHSEQEEIYYVLAGEFSLKLGRSGEAEFLETSTGTVRAAPPMIDHGHRCVGEDGGTVLASAHRASRPVSTCTASATAKLRSRPTDKPIRYA
jgi:oxalate decarboxylase/phosphoglucose isomerase-like protein (cupin superfamily)